MSSIMLSFCRYSPNVQATDLERDQQARGLIKPYMEQINYTELGLMFL